jgi:hypothetical protein
MTSSNTWPRVETLADLDQLDVAEMYEGWLDGGGDVPEPRPGGNRSRSYWHGWRNAMMTKGLIENDDIHRRLVAALFARERARKGLPPGAPVDLMGLMPPPDEVLRMFKHVGMSDEFLTDIKKMLDNRTPEKGNT